MKKGSLPASPRGYRVQCSGQTVVKEWCLGRSEYSAMVVVSESECFSSSETPRKLAGLPCQYSELVTRERAHQSHVRPVEKRFKVGLCWPGGWCYGSTAGILSAVISSHQGPHGTGSWCLPVPILVVSTLYSVIANHPSGSSTMPNTHACKQLMTEDESCLQRLCQHPANARAGTLGFASHHVCLRPSS